MKGVKNWIKALRLPFLTATLIPVFLGTAYAWYIASNFNFIFFLLTLFGISFLHLGTNLTNDYFDHKTKNDWVNKTPTPFSGGSRVIQEALIQPSLILTAAITFFILGSIIGLYLNYVLEGNLILLLGIIGVFCGFFYTASPLKLGYSGIGEILVGLCFGPLVALGSFYVQTEMLLSNVFLISLPVGILIALVLYINEFPDYEADKKVGKKTLIVLLGKRKAAKIYVVLLYSVYLYILVAYFLKIYPSWSLISLVTLPLAFKTTKITIKNYDKLYKTPQANATTIMLHLFIGLILAGSFLLGGLL